VSAGVAVNSGISGQAIQRAAEQGRKALVAYYPVGYPDVAGSLNVLRTLCGEGDTPGADLIEIGLPYSDPVMDGVVIQRAGTRALDRGVRTRDVFTAVETVAATGTTPVVMTYWNLVDRYGIDAFARDLAAAGGAGLITPDLVPDEASDWFAASDAHGLDRIFLVSPSSSEERIAATAAACRGWLYATAVMGVTGTREQSSSLAPDLVARIRALSPQTLVGVGLGVSNGAQAATVAGFADAVIVGSAFIKPMLAAEDSGDAGDLSGVRDVLADLVAGIRR
jgi:tryptophan synthase alpha chain